ncbi:MAG: sulfatase-like hydrolase/transferase [Rikenellaceae bacterium]
MLKDKLILTLGFSCALTMLANAEKKPNVVFIIADDLTYDAVSALGNDEIKTPNLDRLHKKAANFTHVFNQGAFSPAVSLASRTMLNTGKYIWRAASATPAKLKLAGNWPKDAAAYVPNKVKIAPFWSDYMKEAGYDTYMAGKWHVTQDPAKIFDVTQNIRSGMPGTVADSYAVSAKSPNGRHFDPNHKDAWHAADKSIGGQWEGGEHWCKVLADDALSFIETATKKDNPYFMYIGFTAPHDPRQSPQEYLDMYDADKMAVPENFQEVYPYHAQIGANYNSLRDERLLPNPRTKYSVQVTRKEYYALTSYMDNQIGRILDALEAAGQMDNTYIIFTADHGLAVGDHGFAGKQNMYDASIRVPFFIVGPGVKKRDVKGMYYLQDAMATAMDIAGSDKLSEVDFKSLLPLAKGAKTSDAAQKAVYCAYVGLQRMYRTEDYKLIIYPSANTVRLYDMKKDPKELNDLAGDAKYRKTIDALFADLQKMQVELEDQLDLTPYYNNFFAKK